MDRSDNRRPNWQGQSPSVSPSARVDPSALIIGDVRIGAEVFVGPLSILHADQAGGNGGFSRIEIGEGTRIGDGVILYCKAGACIEIGQRVTIGHGVIIHGPCQIGEGCVLQIRTLLYRATIGPFVYVGLNSLLSNVDVPEHTEVPAGSVVCSPEDMRFFNVCGPDLAPSHRISTRKACVPGMRD